MCTHSKYWVLKSTTETYMYILVKPKDTVATTWKIFESYNFTIMIPNTEAQKSFTVLAFQWFTQFVMVIKIFVDKKNLY